MPDMQGNLRDLQSSLDGALRELPGLELSADAKAGSVVATIRTLVDEIDRAMGRQLAHEETMMRQRERDHHFLLCSAQPGDVVAVECWEEDDPSRLPGKGELYKCKVVRAFTSPQKPQEWTFDQLREHEWEVQYYSTEEGGKKRVTLLDVDDESVDDFDRFPKGSRISSWRKAKAQDRQAQKSLSQSQSGPRC